MTGAREEAGAAPLASALLAVTGRGRCHNFHALPGADALGGFGRALAGGAHPGGGDPNGGDPNGDDPNGDDPNGDDPNGDPNGDAGGPPGGLCGRLYAADVSLSGRALDSFFHPEAAMREAQQLAAEAFGADATFFLSCGTSLANRIVLEALSGSGGSALLDSMSHQSVFFAAQTLPGEVCHMPTLVRAGTRRTDIAAALDMLAARRAAGAPFGLVALNASSYDGQRLRLADILPRIVAASPGTAVVVDEAWSAIHTFSPRLAAHSAIPVLRRMARRGTPLPPAVVTQSAHKTMAALRQGSYVHVAGGAATAAAVRDAIFRNHTTSPSWPILASLDVARAHAAAHGAAAVDTALRRRDRFVAALRADHRTARFVDDPGRYSTDRYSTDRYSTDRYYVADPMKLRLNVADGEAVALRRHLYEEHNVYLPRSDGYGLLAHFHIGVSDEDVDAFVCALVRWARSTRPADGAPAPDAAGTDPAIGSAVADYVLSYPPGVPIARPGETWTRVHAELLASARARGSAVFRIRHR